MMSDQHTTNDNAPHGDTHAQDVNVPVIVTVGIIGSLLLVVIIIGIQAWFQYEMQQERQAKIIEVQNPELQQLDNAAAAKLKGGRWAAADRAMTLTGQRYESASDAERSALGQSATPATSNTTAPAGDAASPNGQSGQNAQE